MDFDKYYEARDKVTEIISKDLLGPVNDNEILCDERPLEYYILGKLYPQESASGEIIVSASEDCGELEEEAGISLSNNRNPSSFGITFSLNTGIKTFTVKSKAAQYKLLSKDEARLKLNFEEGTYSDKAHFWQRNELKLDDNIIHADDLTVGKSLKIELAENLFLQVYLHKVYPDGTKTITVTMINGALFLNDYISDGLNSFFQPELQIISDDFNSFGDVRRNVHLNTNEEIAELELLYSRIGDYASGHGCAVDWEIGKNNDIVRLYTEFFPTHELLQMMPSTRFKSDYLQMKKLAESSPDEIMTALYLLTDEYTKWIDHIESSISALPEMHRTAASKNITKCRDTLDNLKKSVNALDDNDVFRAFTLANRAMFLQRKQMLLNSGKYTSDENIKWYPFQLAFFVQEIISFAYPESDERKKVDLLWFPTGGGKTEAYLGIAAFVIFLRRIRNGKNSRGVTVLMRYTLRLLSFQQFERASALICACEIIRKEYNLPGGEIGIGLWAGKALTPNYISAANKILLGKEEVSEESGNPVQLEKCPWCGKPITKENYSCDIQNKRMKICCQDPACKFHKGLPIYLIDEEIYEHTPDFVVATVDKFAQVALNYETSALFGKCKGLLPPELIIQDELHLISGPLGTITGLYEAAFRKLCENRGIPAKTIASTATIRNAKEQIMSLYASDYTQFPPQGIDINDSFFAELSSRSDRPARMYLGCMGIGTSPTTMMIRVMSSLLFASRYLTELGYDDNIVDSFWTITGYFNTLRELGGAIVRVVDDIQDRYSYLKNSKFAKAYPFVSGRKRYDRYKELTSREKSENIGTVIQKELIVKYSSDGSTTPYDFLLSSNMISVGVDVGRLGAMIVVGQPKTTSEYIQATSRVGRETPGLVIATYNQSKSRDRSHYEDFTQYHSSFYRFVEATSVTPFSDRARDRALQALYVILCRNLVPALSQNDDAGNFRRDIPELRAVRNYIYEYVKKVDPAEYEHVISDIERIEEEWESRIEGVPRDCTLKYRNSGFGDQRTVLFDPDYNEDSRFRVLNTMRSVETTVNVSTYE